MIKTTLTVEDAHEILKLGGLIHNESRFKNEPYDMQKCWRVLDATLLYPHRYFVAYDSEFKGFILINIGTEFFNDVKRATDLALYVKPEFRGTSLFVKLILAAEKWAKENDAVELTIKHNTGIELDKATGSFTKLGFDTAGRIFSKEL